MADPDNYVDRACAARRWPPQAIASLAIPRRAASRLPAASRWQTPFGAIMTPNITPDDATGIGSWSAGRFRARDA